MPSIVYVFVLIELITRAITVSRRIFWSVFLWIVESCLPALDIFARATDCTPMRSCFIFEFTCSTSISIRFLFVSLTKSFPVQFYLKLQSVILNIWYSGKDAKQCSIFHNSLHFVIHFAYLSSKWFVKCQRISQ